MLCIFKILFTTSNKISKVQQQPTKYADRFRFMFMSTDYISTVTLTGKRKWQVHKKEVEKIAIVTHKQVMIFIQIA